MSVIARALADLAPAPDSATPDTPPPEPRRRSLRTAPADLTRYGTLTVEEGQQEMREAVAAYLAQEAPAHMLLIAAPAGLGKTTLAVSTAERYAAGAGRCLYLGPRRDFYADILPLMQQPSWWYPWQPRTVGQGQGIGQTCRFAPQIEAWMRRGYSAQSFCSNQRICGYAYMHQDCPWHAQARRPERIVFGQYEHLTLGHPSLETFGLVIGDELPLRAFLHPWHIPAAAIAPPEMPPSPRADLMHTLRQLAQGGDEAIWEGPALLQALGGAAHVADVCADVPLAEIAPPDLRDPSAAEDAPYGHLFDTLRALHREAEQALGGYEYLARVRVDARGLTLYQRRTPRFLAQHMIWLDATASAPMYRTLFGRPVEVVQPDVTMAGKIYQVWPSLNTKTSLVKAAEGAEAPPAKLQHVKAQVAEIIRRGAYAAPAVVTYKGLTPTFADLSTAHFHGSRGTNRLQDCDALIVIGTPQPGGDDIVTMAKMLHHGRDMPFNRTWSTRDRPYAGLPLAHPVSGYWDDHDLQVLLEQLREAELVQALHRARPLRRRVDVWLLTNLPLPGIPVELMSLRDLFGAPDGADPYRWSAAIEIAAERMRDAGLVTSADLVRAGVCQPAAARRYLEALAERHQWRLGTAPPQGRGKPPLACFLTDNV